MLKSLDGNQIKNTSLNKKDHDKEINPPLKISNFREKNNNKLPGYYHWSLHLFTNALILVSLIVFSLNELERYNYSTFFQFIVFFWFWVLVEYFLHRFVLHGKNIKKFEARISHTIYHHGYFTHKGMYMDNLIDINRILLFSKDLLSIIALSICIYGGLYYFNKNTATISLLASLIYILLYETVHFLCHKKLKTCNWLIIHLTKHHKEHHDTSKVKTQNYAVVFTFIDKLFGTYKY